MQSLLCEVAKVGESLASFFSARGESFACTRLLETEGDESKPVGGGWPRYIYIERERERTRTERRSEEVESRRNTFLGCLLVLEMQRRLEEPRRFSNLERE